MKTKLIGIAVAASAFLGATTLGYAQTPAANEKAAEKQQNDKTDAERGQNAPSGTKVDGAAPRIPTATTGSAMTPTPPSPAKTEGGGQSSSSGGAAGAAGAGAAGGASGGPGNGSGGGNSPGQ